MKKLIMSIVIITLVVFTFVYKDAVGGAQDKKQEIKAEQVITKEQIDFYEREIASYEEKTLDFSTTVNISISYDDKSNSKVIESYLLRELREIKGVDIANEIPSSDWLICLIVLPINSIGYAVSIEILQPNYVSEAVNGIFDLCEGMSNDTDRIKEFRKRNPDLEKGVMKYCGSKLRVISKDKLKNTCQEIIAKFDIEHIEPSRKTHQLSQKFDKKLIDIYKSELEKYKQ